MEPDDLSDRKRSVRGHVEVRIAALTSEERVRRSRLACARLLELDQFAEATELLLYSAMPDEVDTTALVDAARKAGKRVFLPRLLRRGETPHDPLSARVGMWFLECSGGSLERHRFGMYEPEADAARWRPGLPGDRRRTLAVCPGRVFDRRGRRLGRGAGYYDRFLAAARSPAVVGICFSVQLVDEAPAGLLDERMDLVVTDRELVIPD